MAELTVDLQFVDRGTDRLALAVPVEPPQDGAPLVVLWPAMGAPARYYRPFAAELHAAGLWPVTVDLRGTGASTPAPSRASRYGYADLVDDVGAVLDALKVWRDGRRTILLGHSLGGQMCALHLALEPNRSTVDGLALVAVGLPYWRCYAGVGKAAVLGYTQAIGATSAVLRVWPGWTFGGRQARGVIRDWAYTARHGRYPRLSGVDIDTALGSVRTPVLAVTIDHDRYTPPATTEQLVGKMTAAPVERAHYTAAQAGGRLNHFAWVRRGGPLARVVRDFAVARQP